MSAPIELPRKFHIVLSPNIGGEKSVVRPISPIETPIVVGEEVWVGDPRVSQQHTICAIHV